MSEKTLTQFCVEFLIEKGYIPKQEDNSEVIIFEIESYEYFIEIDEEINYFRIHSGGTWEWKRNKEREKLYEIVAEINNSIKLVKTSIFADCDEEIVVNSIETIINNQEDLKINFSRWLKQLDSAYNKLLEKAKECDIF